MRLLLPYLALYRRHSGRMLLGILLAIITLLASIGLLALSGWFLAASAVAGFAGLYSFNYMLPAAGVRGAAIFRTAGRYAERLVSHDATFRVLSHLRVDTFARIMPLSPGGLARFRQADLLNRLVADVDTLDHLYLRVISPLVSALVVILVVAAGLSWLDVTLALLLSGIMLALLLLLPLIFYRAGKPVGRALTTLRGEYRIQLTAWLHGQAELVVYGAGSRFRQALESTEQQWQHQQQRQATLGGLAQAIMIAATGLTATLMFWLAAGGLTTADAPGALIALIVFTTLAAFEALGPVAGAFQHLGQVIASAERLQAITGQLPAVSFPAQGAAAVSPSLMLDNVSFTYPGQPFPVVKGVTLQVAAGEHIALLGRTGCGKSTLLQLLTRAWDGQTGSIQLGGHPIADYDEATLRRSMTLVPQQVHVFNTTLRDNLRLAAPEASDARLGEVLQHVGLGALLENSGLNSWLGEGGRPLSGGEQRRIGIARALLHDAPLVLLDEPTEGLDAETEQQILTLLREHCRGKTLIMVTHRLHGLHHLDRICVMDDGKLVEQGPHHALLAAGGRYAQFHARLA
ncbi:cysteine/glutathione ABC transporter ATP-binding protein/permease CydC [Chimaeribacter californicus]|uniref:Glutathione/L-cysteine transport system ATP-binding/permease protein CydC n=1 Tax=Chimaeribacter californicus TaxID=2060067 RepID=A0A2N5EFM2_9GAMM|nr:cysteine/glutathione ABC transporter ATP-binding protein/permease CydC [Chimaeribacter californicus]PLR41309.1 cysteine/glutathione ABC transporter ATP-binding protein/permease CydC [Chimaeribacter californicus]